jgi:hypothetical protein
MDLHDHLDQIAGAAAAPTVAQADADVARGRRALLRRRAGQTVAGSAFGVAALVAAFSVATAGTDAGPHGPAAGSGRSVVATAQLVAYKGTQPKGFTIDKVPAGYFIQADDNFSLLLAPDSAKNPGPDVDPSTSPVFDPSSYADKITIMLESKDQHGPSRDGTKVQVGEHEGTLLKSLRGETPDGPAPTAPGGDTGWELWVKQPSGVYLLVQFWQGLGLRACTSTRTPSRASADPLPRKLRACSRSTGRGRASALCGDR